jgi:hypothetical protein
MSEGSVVEIDASTYQETLRKLSEVIAQKLHREAFCNQNVPGYVRLDLFVLMRQAMWTCDLLYFVNADERRKDDPYWQPQYTIVTAPLVRSIIDCLYNITLILEDPRYYGPLFRKSGFKKRLDALSADEARYGGRSDWDAYIKEQRVGLDHSIRSSGLNMADVMNSSSWMTLGTYLSQKGKGAIQTDHQKFLSAFTYGNWRQYSAMLHAGFEGLIDTASYFIRDAMKHDFRDKQDAFFPRELTVHMARAAIILLSIITEAQAYFAFDGADINSRIHVIWNALMPIFEAEELYTERYVQLMSDKGIKP